MGGFLRMQAFARTAGDDEYVQAVRKDLERGPRRRAIHMALGFALLLVGLIWSLVVPQKLLAALADQEGDVLLAAIRGGIAVGAAAAVFILLGVRFIADVRAAGRHDRTARLMIRYHDRTAQDGDDRADTPGP